jgi:hypothetical protein
MDRKILGYNFGDLANGDRLACFECMEEALLEYLEDIETRSIEGDGDYIPEEKLEKYKNECNFFEARKLFGFSAYRFEPYEICLGTLGAEIGQCDISEWDFDDFEYVDGFEKIIDIQNADFIKKRVGWWIEIKEEDYYKYEELQEVTR